MGITIDTDIEARACYITLSENPIARTIEFSDAIMIDVDEFGVAVGIEIIDESAMLPFNDLVSRFHVHSDVVEFLKVLRSDIAGQSMKFTVGHDGVSKRHTNSRRLTAA